MDRSTFGGCLAILVLFAAVGCRVGGSSGRPCTDSSQCETGQNCGTSGRCENTACSSRIDCPGASTCLATGFCGPEECATAADCGEGRICRERACFALDTLPDCGDGGTCAGGKVCNPQTRKCEDCSTTLRCPVGQACRNGSCEVTQTPCNNDAPCLPTGRVCDLQAGTCVSCSAERPCPSSYICDQGQCKPRQSCQNDSQCTPPMTCDTTAGFCIQAQSVALCGACATDAECQGTGSKCLAFAGGNFCGRACSTGSPCPTGYVCAPQFNQCAPVAGRCRDNCVVTACSAGMTCDPQTGLCMGPKRLCDACTTDAECGGPTDNCLLSTGPAGGRYCAQDCDTTHLGGRPCPTGFTCRDVAPGVKQCVPTGDRCVVDPCAGVQCSSPSAPYCNPATRACVECLESRHCPASDQVCTNNTCVTPGQCANDQGCAGNALGSRCCQTTQGMQCRQCCMDTHCGGATPYCVGNVCQGNPDPCAGVTCVPPQVCNPATGNCEGGGGGGTSCANDADCGDPANLRCDPTFNFCYSIAGICASDGMCAPGQSCLGASQGGFGFCSGCVANLFYCPPGLICLPLDANGLCFPNPFGP